MIFGVRVVVGFFLTVVIVVVVVGGGVAGRSERRPGLRRSFS